MNKAFLFDLNGTLINDMDYHINAWHKLLNELGANISVERMTAECYGKGDELIERILPQQFSYEQRIRISVEKEAIYRDAYKPHLHLINGAFDFLEAAYKAGIPMAIGSAAPTPNVDFVLDGMNIRHFFKAVISGDDVQHSKPNPETFLLCANKLQIAATNCIVFEDAIKGVEAAANAGMSCVVLTTLHQADEFTEFNNIIKTANDFTQLSILAFINQYQ